MTEMTIRPTPLSIPRREKKPRRGLTFRWMALFAAAAAGGVLWARGAGSLPFWSEDQSTKLPTMLVDRGDIPVYVVESGALESADNATIICEVEALLGQVTSNLKTAGVSSTPTLRTAATPKAATATAAAGTAAAATKVGAAAKAAPAAGGASATASVASASGGVARPTIQSFTMVIAPHVPLRGTPATVKQAAPPVPRNNNGGGGRNNGGNGQTGSTRILWIAEEGTRVKPGDVVAKLDSAAFIDERRAQLIRVAQARSWVEQAERVQEVTKIALREYEKGIFPQDQLLINQYIQSCKTQVEKARADLQWARGVVRKGLRSDIQFKADQFTAVKSDIVLQEALGMKARLEKYTAPRLIINIKAKLDSVQSDLLAQKEAYKLEEDRLKRIEKMIEKCTLRAPREGIVVYANQANGWGRVEAQIMEGATVREGQPIINLPNPNRMRVRAKINESKITSIVPGLRAQIIADAFPDTSLPGVVTEVTAIPGPANGPISDVKVYFAMVRIDGGDHEGLRPGMSAEVAFQLDSKRDVVRVPLKAIRWLDGDAYVAIPGRNGPGWRKLDVGLLNPTYAEVRSGLAPGERVIATPESLPGPTAERLDSLARSTEDYRG
jgi:multidrug resistance efflux pump